MERVQRQPRQHGCTGNFTQYRTRVPLIIYAPRGPVVASPPPPRRWISRQPSCRKRCIARWNTREYSNGFNLFGQLPERRPIVVASYIHHALILGEKVFVVWPMYVQRYDLTAKNP